MQRITFENKYILERRQSRLIKGEPFYLIGLDSVK